MGVGRCGGGEVERSHSRPCSVPRTLSCACQLARAIDKRTIFAVAHPYMHGKVQLDYDPETQSSSARALTFGSSQELGS